MTVKIKKNLLLTSPIYIKQREYWLNKLANEIVETNFQFSEIKKNQGDGDVKDLKKLEFFFPDDLSVRLFKLSKKSDLSLYIILLAALKILIYRYTGNDDIIVISPVNKLKASLGTINNYLFIRDKVNGSMTFKELLLNVRTSVLQAYQNQDYPLNDLIKSRTAALQVKNDNNISNITCLLKNLHGHGNTGELNGKFTFSFAREKEWIKGNILYDGSSCKKYYLDRAAAHFINILAASIGDVNVKISGISFLAEKEKKQLLFDFNDTGSPYPSDKTIDLLFEEQAVLKPNNIAVVEADTNGFISYHELNEKADGIAVYLQQKGLKVDQAVGIMSEHSIEMITGVLAILKAGGAYLPINPVYPPERKKYLLADSNARILITTCQHTSISASLQDVLNLKDSDVYHTVYYDLEKEHHHDNLAYIIYTSGSTGKPKGTMVEHKNVIRLVRNTNYIKFREKDRILQTGALEFDASTFEIWGVLLNCLSLYLASRDNLLAPQKLKEILKRNEITTIWMTSPLFNQMVDADIEIFSKLENLLVGGDVLSPSHINRTRNRYPGLNIINGYGPTENTTFTCTYRIRKDHSKNIPIGKPIANSTAYILDKYYHFVPVGVVGELLAGGDGVARGYLNNPEKTAEKFKRAVIKSSLKTNDRSAQVFAKDHSPMINDRLYFTGDLGYRNPEGTIEFCGRKDNQVKIRGYRIELGEIENKLLEYHCIKEAVVLVKEESHDSKYLCAYLVLDGKPGKLEIKNHLLKRLPDYMVPTQFIHLEQMPLTPNGKIDRKALARINSSAAFLPYITEEMLELLDPGIQLSKPTYFEKYKRPGTVIGKFAPRPIELKARIEQLIKIDEVIIDVGKIEYCLLENDDIDEAVIDIKTDKTNKKHLCAYVTSEKSISEPKLRTYLSENLPHHMIPEYLIQLEKIPLTPNGKIRRKVLELIEPHQYIQKEFIAPRNIIEEKLLEIWANVLAIKKEIISIDSNFFALHGNSLGVIKLISLIYNELDEEVPMTQIFRSPTIKDIAKYLLNKKYEKYENHQYIPLNKSKPNPVFAFPPIVGTGLSYAKLEPYLQDYSLYSFNFIEDENRIKKYVDIITGITTNRPYVLLGYSSGGNLAFEVAKGLEESGYQVSDIIIIDSIKKLGKLPFSDSEEKNEKMREISKKIEEFFKALGIEFMKDEAVTKSMKYSTYFRDLQNTGVVNANLHVITGERKDGKEIESSTAFAPPTAWEKSTNNNFILYQGVGGHVEMLESNFIKKNIEIIKKILDRVFSRESQ